MYLRGWVTLRASHQAPQRLCFTFSYPFPPIGGMHRQQNRNSRNKIWLPSSKVFWKLKKRVLLKAFDHLFPQGQRKCFKIANLHEKMNRDCKKICGSVLLYRIGNIWRKIRNQNLIPATMAKPDSQHVFGVLMVLCNSKWYGTDVFVVLKDFMLNMITTVSLLKAVRN